MEALSRRRRQRMDSQKGSHSPKPSGAKKCTRCGRGWHPRERCPAREAICHKCGSKGHYKSECRTKSVSEVANTDSAMDAAFLGNVGEKITTREAWYSSIILNKRSTRFKLDTGAEVTAIGINTYRTLGKPRLSSPRRVLYGPSKQQLATLGQFEATFTHKGKTASHTVYVIDGLNTNLLGLPAIISLGLATRLDAVSTITPIVSTGNKEEIAKQFPSLFAGLGNLGHEYKIKLKPGATPHRIYTPRHVALPLRDKVKQELEKMEALNVVSKIEEPTEWCAGMVVVPKSDGRIRICVDLKPLNTNVMREVHPLPTVDETLAQLTGAKRFSKIDANSGFWQIPLAKESRHLTTFITPFGRYCFNKMPFGISCAPEHFQRRMSQILERLEGVLCQMDDVLIFGRNDEEHDARLGAALKRIQDAGVTLNKEKCEFRKSELKFLGHIINQHGIRADAEKTSAVANMKTPSTITELRRFMGMVNQLGKFSPNIADLSQPIRPLLSKRADWLWGTQQDEAFESIKKELTKPAVLALYDPKSNTKVCADASSYGLGAVLMQEHSGSWRPVAYASKSLSETEKRYAQIEKEALASTWACEKFAIYLLGKSFLIETDHKPLIPLLGFKNLHDLPPRVLRFRLRLARFDYSISHVPGKLLYTADALSRDPLVNANQDSMCCLQEEADTLMELNTSSLPASEHRLLRYQQCQEQDPVCSKVIQYCQSKWPNKRSVSQELKPYWEARGLLTVSKNNLLLYGNRIVVPEILKRETMEKLHSGHQGITRSRLRAKLSVWWPGISGEIERYIKQCTTCSKHIKNRREPLIPTPLPEYPWQKVSTDLFQLNKHIYLVVTDYYSRYPEVHKLKDTTSKGVIMCLKEIFGRWGIPEIIVSDNGPQYNSQEFSDFARAYEFKHVTSSPLYPQSNGHAERSVQTVKKLLRESEDPDLSLLVYRSTPLPWCNLSPAQLLMGRCPRSNIPSPKESLIPKWEYLKEFERVEKKFKRQQKHDFDRHHRVQSLPDIQDDSSVWITSGNHPTPGVVQFSLADAPRSYLVQTDTGTVRRNRQHLSPNNGANSTPDSSATRSPIMTRSRTGTAINPPDRYVGLASKGRCGESNHTTV